MTGPTEGNVTRLLVEVTWEGDYYRPHERAELVEDWIAHALEDRAGNPTVQITNLAARTVDLPGQTPEQTLAARRTHTAAVRRLLDATVDAALPHAGGNIRLALTNLRRALDHIPANSATTEETTR